MKPILLAVISLLTIQSFSQVKFSNLQFKPSHPNRGDKLVFTYNPAGTPVMSEKNIDAVVYVFADKASAKVKEIPLKRTGGKYTGSFTVDSNATLIAFRFDGGEQRDGNGQKGYLIPVYKGEKPVAGAGLALANMYSSSGRIVGIEEQPELALQYLQSEWKDYPERRVDFAIMYFNILHKVRPNEAPGILNTELKAMESAGNLTEAQYSTLEALYTQYKMKEKADAIAKEKKEKFPNGGWLKTEKLRKISGEKDLAKQEQMIHEYLKEYPSVDEASKQRNSYLISLLMNAKAKEKDWESFKNYAKQVGGDENKMGVYNNMAWGMAERGEDLEIAKELSREATLWAKKQITLPTDNEGGLRTRKQVMEDRNYTYSMFADTYAFILYHLKDYKTGLQYAKDAVDLRKRLDPEYNDRYAMLLEKAASPQEVKKELAPIVKEGKAGGETKTILRRALLALNNSEAETDRYFAAIEAESLERIKKALEKKMVNENAPLFRLVNLEKKEVSLQDLKGKVVIVDFWATWCGPCIASFPGMQKAVNKYKDNPNVVFLFIDTWETGDDREKLVTDFIKSKNYNFNVLYDEKKKENPAEFAVVSSYKVEGIPTKFIIDPDGNIRFKSVGFSGSEDALVQEISTMIEMAAASKKM
jgi:thiol-disulfide isomerase/thioredoxin